MRLIVFSDLDGTLLDHQTYSAQAAQPALDRLQALGVPVILASSKTAVEIAQIQAQLGLEGLPAIVENGAALLQDGADNSAYLAIRKTLDALPSDLRQHYVGFGDLDVVGVAQLTGLPLPQAALAKTRNASEPGTWRGSEADLDKFLLLLGEHGISARRGGRFLTLSFGATKADRMRELIDASHADVSIALGDAPNDTEMIQLADYGVIVRNDHASPLPPMDGEVEGKIRRKQETGPEGWCEAVTQILNELGC